MFEPDRTMRLCQCRVFPNISLARSLIWSLTACSPRPGAMMPRATTSSNSATALAWALSSRPGPFVLGPHAPTIGQVT